MILFVRLFILLGLHTQSVQAYLLFIRCVWTGSLIVNKKNWNCFGCRYQSISGVTNILTLLLLIRFNISLKALKTYNDKMEHYR